MSDASNRLLAHELSTVADARFSREPRAHRHVLHLTFSYFLKRTRRASTPGAFGLTCNGRVRVWSAGALGPRRILNGRNGRARRQGGRRTWRTSPADRARPVQGFPTCFARMVASRPVHHYLHASLGRAPRFALYPSPLHATPWSCYAVVMCDSWSMAMCMDFTLPSAMPRDVSTHSLLPHERARGSLDRRVAFSFFRAFV